MKRIGLLYVVLSLLTCSVKAETLTDWIASQPERDTLRLVKLSLTKPVVGVTAPNIQPVVRDQWDVQKRKALRYVRTEAGITFAELRNGGVVRNKIAVWVRGLATVNDKTDNLATYIPVFWIAYDEYRDVDVSGEDDEVEYIDIGSQPILGLSPAETNGWIDLINAPDSEKYRLVEEAQQ